MSWARKMLPAFGAMAAILLPAAALSGDLERALSLAAEKRDAEAREVLDTLPEREAADPTARLLHGFLRAREHRLGEAIDTFEGLRRDYPDMPEPYNNLAVLHAVQGRLEEARETLLAGIELRPDLAAAHANLAAVYTTLALRASARARELGYREGPHPEPGEATSPVLTLPDPPVASPAAAASPVATDSATAAASPAAASPATATASPATAGSPTAAASPIAAASLPAAASPETRAPETAPAALCVRAGRFKDRAAASAAEQWLRSHGLEIVELRLKKREVVSNRVYLTPFATRREAVAKVREIRARGIRDVAVISRGPLANGVSFGLYRVESNAHRRVAGLERIGYPVQRSQVTKTVHEYEIEARAGAGGPRADHAAAWASRFPRHPLQAAKCRR